MRFYGFGNYYLSSLQQGLQAAHVVGDLSVNVIKPTCPTCNIIDQLAQSKAYFEWARKHKTMVLLNGGNSADLQELFDFMATTSHPYPFAKFHEDQQSLGGALTYVGIILPAKIYDTAATDRVKGWGTTGERPTDFTDWEEALILRLNQYGLAK